MYGALRGMLVLFVVVGLGMYLFGAAYATVTTYNLKVQALMEQVDK